MNYIKETIKTLNTVELINYLPDIGLENVQQEILNGLNAHKKYISPKFFYDQKGSELFEKITALEEYYPTRTEKSILATLFQKIDVDFNNLKLIELGSGDHSKIRLLLSQLSAINLNDIHYFPIDISSSAIKKAAENLIKEFPELSITGITADFMHQLNILPKEGNKFICFLGSTIGNLTENEQVSFIQQLSKEMNQGDRLLIGFDMVKDVTVLEKAYNDTQQITAEFNLNVLEVVNLLSNSNFDVTKFKHKAYFNSAKSRIEMHLVSVIDQCVSLDKGQKFINFKQGETIHTENSYKFTDKRIKTLATNSALQIEQVISDEKNWFNLVIFTK